MKKIIIIALFSLFLVSCNNEKLGGYTPALNYVVSSGAGIEIYTGAGVSASMVINSGGNVGIGTGAINEAILDSGTVTLSKVNNTTFSYINDSTKSWVIDQWKGKVVKITGGTGAGQTGYVRSNTATELTITTKWTIIADLDSTYQIAEEESKLNINGNISANKYTFNYTNFNGDRNKYRIFMHEADRASVSCRDVCGFAGNSACLAQLTSGSIAQLPWSSSCETAIDYPICLCNERI